VGSRRNAVLAWLADALLVTLFVVIGRASHREDQSGLLTTLVPFFAGLQTGWLLRAGRAPRSVVGSGLIVWASTLILGMVFRAVLGQGVAISFVIVATIVLAVFLLGWRAIAALVLRVRSRRGGAAAR
jgi:FtsH-binding integral membrane protein